MRIQKLARLGYPGSKEQQEEEGVTAFKEGIKDDRGAAEGLVLTKAKTVQECVETLTELERFRLKTGKAQPNLRLRPLEDEHTGEQPQAGAQSPKGPANTESAESKALRKELAQMRQGMAEFNKGMNSMLGFWQRMEQGQAPPQQQPVGPTPGQRQPNFQGGSGRGFGRGRARRPYVEYPSAEQPCRICQSPEHWERRCPQRDQQAGAGANRGPVAQQGNQRPGNGDGLGPRSGGQSAEKR